MKTFEELYETYVDDVYRFAYWMCGNSAEAEDIASETFIRVWVGRHKIRTETVKAYLLTIARNLCLKGIQKRKRIVDLTDQLPEPAPLPEKLVTLRSEVAQLRTALATLPEVDRTALILHAQHKLPYAEIARMLNLSLSAAKVKVYRARRKLMLLRAAELETTP